MIQPLKIGSLHLDNNLILAPMAGITNRPMRLLARELGAGFCFTEMISANGLAREANKTLALMMSTPTDHPLGIQLFGDDPYLLAEGAKVAAEYGELIDINMGCPVRKVVNSGAGSALLSDPIKVRTIIREVRKEVSIPLTIKIRSGRSTNDRNFIEIGRIAEDEGCDAITLHPRSRAQMFEGRADRRQIEQLKKTLRIPVIGSGDVFTAEDVINMLNETGCDGVMIARGALGNPWIFRSALQLLSGEEHTLPTVEEKLSTALRHLDEFIELAGERTALCEMRKHLCWYAKGIPGAPRFRDFINRTVTKEALQNGLKDFFLSKGQWAI